MYSCKTCGRKFEKSQQLNAHQVSHRNAPRYSVVRIQSNRKDRNRCLFCEKEVKTSVAIYCSNNCQQNYTWEKVKAEIEKTGYFSSSVCGTIPKRYYREKQDHRCAICNLKDWFGKPIPLILDHIDGNSDNWLVPNLRMICPNCDTFLPTFKSRNRGNGRAWRRRRYEEGKSY